MSNYKRFNASLTSLIAAIEANEKGTATDIGVNLGATFLDDVHRIAIALENIAESHTDLAMSMQRIATAQEAIRYK